jgi:hypothetical protein
VLPLSARQTLVTMVGRQKLPAALRFEFAMGMLTDLGRRDPIALHRFLWSNHLAYAASYEAPHRFGASNINPTRHALFEHFCSSARAWTRSGHGHPVCSGNWLFPGNTFCGTSKRRYSARLPCSMDWIWIPMP